MPYIGNVTVGNDKMMAVSHTLFGTCDGTKRTLNGDTVIDITTRTGMPNDAVSAFSDGLPDYPIGTTVTVVFPDTFENSSDDHIFAVFDGNENDIFEIVTNQYEHFHLGNSLIVTLTLSDLDYGTPVWMANTNTQPATTNSLGEVTIGSGLSVTSEGLLSTLGGATWFGVSTTASNTTNKDVTCDGYLSKIGNIIAVQFSNGNTANSPYLNINNTGNIPIAVGGTLASSTTNVLKWSAGTILYFIYSGTYYHYLGAMVQGSTQHPMGGGAWYGTSTSSTTVAAKIASITNFRLTPGAFIAIHFSYGNTENSLTLNVNNTGTKAIYKGVSATSPTNKLRWEANATLYFMYDGSYWRYMGQDNLPIASSSTLGEVKVGNGLNIDSTGVLSTENITAIDQLNDYSLITKTFTFDQISEGIGQTWEFENEEYPEITNNNPMVIYAYDNMGNRDTSIRFTNTNSNFTSQLLDEEVIFSLDSDGIILTVQTEGAGLITELNVIIFYYRYSSNYNKLKLYDGNAEIGRNNTAINSGSLAIGTQTSAKNGSFSQGIFSTATGIASTALGLDTIARQNFQTVLGRYNEDIPSTDGVYPLIIGNGTFQSRKNIFKVRGDGWVDSLAGYQITNPTNTSSISKIRNVTDGTFHIDIIDNGSPVYNWYFSHLGNLAKREWDTSTNNWGDAVYYLPSDTTPQTLTLSSSCVEYDAGSTPVYAKDCKTVSVWGAVKPKSAVSAGDTMTIATLPSGYRPRSTSVYQMCQGSSGAIWFLRITTAGTMTCERYRNGSTNAAMSTTTWLPFTATFLTS